MHIFLSHAALTAPHHLTHCSHCTLSSLTHCSHCTTSSHTLLSLHLTLSHAALTAPYPLSHTAPHHLTHCSHCTSSSHTMPACDAIPAPPLTCRHSLFHTAPSLRHITGGGMSSSFPVTAFILIFFISFSSFVSRASKPAWHHDS